MRIALAGAGAFGEKHLDGLKLIDGVEITPADLRIHANVRCETIAPALLATLPTCLPATPRREFV